MFDVGFFELVVVGIVALIVLGPEKLPGAIKTASLWIGRLRRSFNTIKQDIEREIGADEIRRQLRNEEIMEKYRATRATVNEAIDSVKKETEAFKKNVELEAKAAGMSSEAPAKPPLPDTQALAADQDSALVPDSAPSDMPAEAPAPAAEAPVKAQS